MLRAVFGYKREVKINMQRLRESISMFSVNQMNCYHVLVEAYNVVKNGSSNIIQEKWTHKNKENEYCLRSKTNQEVKVPNKRNDKCLEFSYYGAQLDNQIP